MNLKRLTYKTVGRYLLAHTVVRFFLLSAGSGGTPDATRASAVDEIRKKGHKILVIDDDDEFRKSFCFKLARKYKARVENVSSGESGIEMLKGGNSYDFIFTDIMMPGMTGVETYHELRKIDADTPVVIMSAYSDSEEWKKAQALEGVALIHKPIPDDLLIEILSERGEE